MSSSLPKKTAFFKATTFSNTYTVALLCFFLSGRLEANFPRAQPLEKPILPADQLLARGRLEVKGMMENDEKLWKMMENYEKC